MRISKRQLLSLIREQQELITEQQKFDRMLLEAEDKEGGKYLKMAFSAIKKSKDAAKWVVQFLKANPEIGEAVMSMLASDEEAEISDVEEEPALA
jgi:hypothetical protein